MPWIVGVDEAGYGPNLGPFVMTAVACRVPRPLLTADLWQVLGTVVRRHADDDDERILIDDSKLVYSTAAGLGALERARGPDPRRAAADHDCPRCHRQTPLRTERSSRVRPLRFR